MPARRKPLQRAGETSRKEARGPVQDPSRRLVRVIDLLEINLGQPLWDGPKDALEVLVLTILSQNTTDPNALRGYENLVRHTPGELAGERDPSALPRNAEGEVDKIQLRLSHAARALHPPDWSAVMAMPLKKLAGLIRAAGLPDAKAAAIQAALCWVHEISGGWTLEPLIERLGVDEAIEKMTRLKGIGLKTAAVTLIEAMGADLCPVDTHVHRVINRLGVVETGSDRNRTWRELRPLIPEKRAFSLHHNLLTFGRTVCTAKKPRCRECFLRKLCPSAETTAKP